MNDHARTHAADADVDADAPTTVSPPAGRPQHDGAGERADAGGDARGPHIWLVRWLLGLAVVLSIIGIFAVWANRQLLDTSYWTETNTKLLENAAIQEELSSYLTTQLYQNINVADEIRNGLPSEFKQLAGPAAGGLRSVIEKGIVLALQQPRVQQLWKTANGVTHRQFVNLIENKSKVIHTPGGGAVILDLRPIVAELATRFGAPASTAEKLPKNIAQIKIFSSKSLETMQSAVRLLRSLAVILPVLVLLLFAAALALARGRRSRTLVNIGLVCIGSALVVLVARSIIGSKVVDTLATTEAVRPAASAAWSIGTSVLVDVAGALIFIGAVVVVAGWLGGRSRGATSVRHSLAPYLRDHPGISFGVLAVVLLILFAWGPIEATQQLDGIVLITVLSFFGLEMLRRQTLAEFPDVAYVGGHDAVRRGMASMRDAVARGRASMHSVSGHGGSHGADQVDRLERLAALHANGSLTDEEYAAAKRDLIGS